MFIDGMLKIDKRPKFLGWCPGDYLGQCRTCGNQYIGDKRAVICADCAYREIPEGYALVPVDLIRNVCERLQAYGDEEMGRRVVDADVEALKGRIAAAQESEE